MSGRDAGRGAGMRIDSLFDDKRKGEIRDALRKGEPAFGGRKQMPASKSSEPLVDRLIAEALEESGSPSSQDGDFEALSSSFMLAASEGDLATVLDVLMKGTLHASYQDSRGRTALMEASRYGHAGVAEILIGHGAAVDLKDNDGWTALAMAEVNKHQSIVELLKRAGAK